MKFFASLLAFLFFFLIGLASVLPISASAQEKLRDPDSSFAQGIELYRNDRYLSALDFFKKAAEEEPNNPEVQYYEANTLVRLGREDDAFLVYLSVDTKAPKSRAARLSRVALTRLRHLGYASGGKRGKYIVGASFQEAEANGKLKDLKPDYLHVQTIKGLRWDAKAMPLNIYVPKQQSRRASVHYEELIPKAMNEWVKASHGLISYRIVTSPDEADIKIVWVEVLGDSRAEVLEKAKKEGGHKIGVTELYPGADNKIMSPVIIRYAVRDFGTNHAYSKLAMYTVMLHESGHALGLLGHSDYTKDVMTSMAHNRTSLSPRDKASILRLYRDF